MRTLAGVCDTAERLRIEDVTGFDVRTQETYRSGAVLSECWGERRCRRHVGGVGFLRGFASGD